MTAGMIEVIKASFARLGIVDSVFYDWTNEGEGKQLVLRFANGYGLSICSERKAGMGRRYADDANNLWEVGITKYFGPDINDWNLQEASVNPNSPETADGSVYGWQSAEQIENLIRIWTTF